MSYIRTILLFFHLMSFGYLWAQNSSYIFEHFSVKDGLANNTIHNIFQDSKGFIWLATENGASRFDGYEFVNFRKDPRNRNSIISNRVHSVAEDITGNLFFATKEGLSVLNQRSQNFQNYEPNKENVLSISDADIRAVIVDKKNRAWVLSYSGGLNILEDEKKIFAKIHNPAIFNRGKEFYDAIIDNSENIWISSAFGIMKFDINKNSVTFHDFKIDKSEWWNWINMGGWNKKLYLDSKDNIWNATRGQGVFKLDTKTGEISHYPHNQYDHLISNSITCITEDKYGNIWLGTDGDGIIILNPITNEVLNIRHNPENTKSLCSNAIYSIFTDNTGNIWIGSFKGGLSVYYPDKLKFTSFRPIPNKKNSLSHRQVLSIQEDDEKNIWIGTDGGGVNKYNPQRPEKGFTRIKSYKNTDSLNSDIIKCITQLNNREIWMGTYMSGIEIYHKQNNKFKHLKANQGAINDNNIWSFAKDNEGILWIATLNNGLNSYNINTGKFYHHRWGVEGQIHSPTVLVVYVDRNDVLWVGTETSGLYKYNKSSNTFQQYRSNKKKKGTISSNNIFSIFMDSKKRLWTGTNGGGLNLLNKDEKSFTLYTESDGLANNIVNDILEDNKGNLWISTGNGLSKFNPATSQFKNYDISDGLQDNQFTFGAALKASDGSMYFGGVNGFSKFFPDSVKDNLEAPKIVFIDILINNQPVIVGAKGSPLKESIFSTKKITLRPKDAVITFKYAALNYTNAHKNKYAYQLVGFDETWTNAGNKREVSFTSLEPGNYTLKVKASNNDGFWNEKGLELEIEVLPPFWKTWWFKILITVFIIGIIVGYYYLRLNQLKSQRKVLTKLVERRTAEIENKNEELKQFSDNLIEINSLLKDRNSKIEEQSKELGLSNKQLSELNSTKNRLFSIIGHDLKNPLNAIMGISEILSSNWKDIEEGEKIKLFKHINSSAKGMDSLLSNLLTWARSQRMDIQFNPEETNVLSLINENKMLLKELLKKKNIKLLVSTSTNTIVYVDQNMIDTILRNIITNAIKFTPQNGHINISVDPYSDDFILVKISDTGMGISDENLSKLFKLEYKFSTYGTDGEKGTGMGLILCKEFIEKHKGEIWVESKEGEGSHFYFTLPKTSSII